MKIERNKYINNLYLRQQEKQQNIEIGDIKKMECKQGTARLNIEEYNELIRKSISYDLFMEQFINLIKYGSSLNYCEKLSLDNDELNYLIRNLIPKEYKEQLEKLKKEKSED